jgi:hypothetical protein
MLVRRLSMEPLVHAGKLLSDHAHLNQTAFVFSMDHKFVFSVNCLK